MPTIDVNQLLEKYKKIYFDADYYLKQKAAAYNANQVDGRTDWTVANLGITNAWEDFSTKGCREKNANGATGINPSKYFDVSRYYQDWIAAGRTDFRDTTDHDPITQYAQVVSTRYALVDPVYATMEVTPRMVEMGTMDRDVAAGGAALDVPKSLDDGLISNLQFAGSLDWNYIGLTQGNILYYSFDENMNSWGDSFLDTKKDVADIGSPHKLNEQYHSYCHTIFSNLNLITGIEFKETTDINRSNIHLFGSYSVRDVVGDTGHVGVTLCNTDYSETAVGIWVIDDKSYYDEYIYYILTHEIGHALGLRHPFGDGITDRFNDLDYTVMSYTDGVTYYGAAYGPRDLLALQYLYGTDGLNGAEGVSYHYADEALPGGGKLVKGTACRDTLTGGAGNDSLTGGADDDLLDGGDGDDTLVGGLGDDRLTGGAGKDTFIVNKGDGRDRILDAEAKDVLRLGPGIGASDLTARLGWKLPFFNFTIPTDALTLRIGDAQGVVLPDWKDSTDRLTEVVLDNGVKVGLEALVNGAYHLTGTMGDESLAGDEGKDTLIGGWGNDTLTGGAGADFFSFSASYMEGYSDGQDVITDATKADVIFIQGLKDLTEQSVSFSVSGDDLVIGYGERNNRITVLDWLKLAQNQRIAKVYGAVGVVNDGQGVAIDVPADLLSRPVVGDGGGGNGGGGAGLRLVGDEGRDKRDRLYGEEGDDWLEGLEDNDTLIGKGGNDRLFGGEGHDMLDGEDGNDTLSGGEGDDHLYGGADNDTLDGGEGDDLLYGGADNDTLDGGEGNDLLSGEDGDDTLFCGAGDDTLYGGSGDDEYVFNAGDGQDVIATFSDYSTVATDTLRFGSGIAWADLRLESQGASTGNDLHLVFNVGDNGDRITWLKWFGLFVGGGSVVQERMLQYKVIVDGRTLTMKELFERKPVYGVDNSRLVGHDGPDTLIGGGGGNLHGYGGDDSLSGGGGNNLLYGGADNDTLDGGAGNDWLYGEDGDDTLIGGEGNDTLSGGAGDDLFLVNLGDGQDTITDAQTGDVLSLGPGIALADLKATLSGSRLVLNIGETGDQTVALTNWSGANRLAEATLENGVKVGLAPLADGRYALTGTENADTLSGGDGNDTISGEAGDDTLKGGMGRDTLYGGAGEDRLYGGGGRDYLEGGADNDFMRGQANHDRLFGGDGNDTLFGDDGDDTLKGGMGRDRLYGGDGEDRLYGGGGRDYLEGGADNDFLRGQANHDRLFGGDGNDTLFGDDGDDTIKGGMGRDRLYGGGGNDRLYGGGGRDYVEGGAGNDFLRGQANHDRVYGGTGNDSLFGDDGDDSLFGEAGNDSLYGGVGNDTLNGGLGNDLLSGAAGRDVFVFDTALNARTNVDRITNFRRGEDTIRLKKSIFGKLSAGNLSAANFRASANGQAGDSNDFLLYNTTTGALSYDADGNGRGAAVQFATLSNRSELKAEDFVVVA